MTAGASGNGRYTHGGAVYLRPLQEEDVTETYLAWFRDAEVTRYLDAKNITREDAIAHLRAGKQGDMWRMYAICETTSNRHIGNLKIGPIHWRYRISDLITVIGERNAWGKGYAREAIKIGIDVAFRHMNLRKLSASMDANNAGSLKAYTAAGFALEARLKDQCMDISSGKPILSDMLYVACFNSAFDAKEAAAEGRL